MKLEIKPFDEFWVNCLFNSEMSILCTLESSYRYLAYLNNYSYIFHTIKTDNEAEVSMITLDIKLTQKNEAYFKKIEYTSFEFKKERNYLEKLKMYLDNNIVEVVVDLFYWLPNSACWNSLHWFHPSIINGYDDEKRIFFVLDDDFNGYSEHEIPYDRATKAILSESKTCIDGYIVNIPSQLHPYKLSVKEVYDNSRRLSNELAKLDINERLCELKPEDANNNQLLKIISFDASKIVWRQVANVSLFTALHQAILVSQDVFLQLIEYCKILSDGWSIIKGMILKSCYSKVGFIKKDIIHEKVKKLFNQERVMWTYLCDNLEFDL